MQKKVIFAVEMTLFESMKKIFVLLFLLIPFMGISQVNIKISFDNQQDSIVLLYKYRGSKTLILDTLVQKNGVFQIKHKEKLPEGIYLLTSGQNFPLAEVLVGKKQRFSVIFNDLEDLNSVKVKGCAKETKIYYRLMAKVRETEANIEALESEEGYRPDNWKKIDSLKHDLANYEESLKIRKKGAIINMVINSMKRHGMEDYWDSFPLDDARILTYPLIDNKLETYFDNLRPDAGLINDEIDKLIAKTGDCVEVRDYLIWYFHRKYYSPQYMNLDDIYIHLVDEYFSKNEVGNVSESFLNMIVDRANYLKNLRIGSRLPEIGNLYSIKAEYITVIFYDKTCQKCSQEGRILEEIRTRHPEMVIFPVEVNSTSIKNLLSKYDIQTTPMIYLLDRKKNIIAKRIKAGQVEQFLNMD